MSRLLITGGAGFVGSNLAVSRAGDVPVYISDCGRLFDLDDWRPRRSARQVLTDIHEWIVAEQERIGHALKIDPAAAGRE